jgi:hypothetical protein
VIKWSNESRQELVSETKTWGWIPFWSFLVWYLAGLFRQVLALILSARVPDYKPLGGDAGGGELSFPGPGGD